MRIACKREKVIYFLTNLKIDSICLFDSNPIRSLLYLHTQTHTHRKTDGIHDAILTFARILLPVNILLNLIMLSVSDN